MDSTNDSSPLKRFVTFFLGLGTFVLFGLLSMCAYKATGGDNDPAYAAKAEERTGVRRSVENAQAELLQAAPVDLAASVASLGSKKPAASAKPVPGTAAFAKKMKDDAAAAAAASEAAGSEAGGTAAAGSPNDSTGATEEGTAAAEAAPKEAALVEKLSLAAVSGGLMKFDKTELTVKAGSEVHLTFANPDILQHNFLLVEIGSKDKVGAAADKDIANPNAMKNGYIPQDPEIKKLILAYSKLLNSGQTEVLKFKAPAKAGNYPYICTFPGHWRIMNGVLKVTE